MRWTRLATLLVLGGLPRVFAELQELDTVEVTALGFKDPEVRASTSRIEAVDLLKRGAVTLPDALQREPGVSVPLDVAGIDPLVPYLEGGSAGINVRGLQGNRVRISVDGIPQPDDFVARSFEGAGTDLLRPCCLFFDGPAAFGGPGQRDPRRGGGGPD